MPITNARVSPRTFIQNGTLMCHFVCLICADIKSTFLLHFFIVYSTAHSREPEHLSNQNDSDEPATVCPNFGRSTRVFTHSKRRFAGRLCLEGIMFFEEQAR